MKTLRWLSLSVLVCLLAACADPVVAPARSALPAIGLRVGNVDRPVALAEAIKSLPVVTLQTKAPAYHGAIKTYKGVDLLNLLNEEGAGLTGNESLTFVCSDGYRSQLAGSHLQKHRAILTWAEVDAAGKDIALQPVRLASGNVIDPAPLYVVWEEAAIADTYPSGWPFAVLRIEVAKEAPAAPLDPQRITTAPVSPTVAAGYQTWARVCFACHSLSGLGGRIGPELNRPVNVTEYFQRDGLLRYIRDWSSVREPHGNEKMPKFTELLSEAEIAAVVDYLQFMAQHKDLK